MLISGPLSTTCALYIAYFVADVSCRNREEFAYYANLEWAEDYVSSANFTRYENTPRSEWTKETQLEAAVYEDW